MCLPKRNFNTFYARNPAVIPIVVGKDAAHQPSLLISFSVSSTKAKGDAHAKQPDSPGSIN